MSQSVVVRLGHKQLNLETGKAKKVTVALRYPEMNILSKKAQLGTVSLVLQFRLHGNVSLGTVQRELNVSCNVALAWRPMGSI